MRFTLLLPLVLPLMAGAQSPVIPTRRVESGVTILQHKADAFRVAPQTVLEARPIWTIGGAAANADYNLEDVYAISILSDGRIAGFAMMGNTLQVYSPTGKPERLIGRQGAGPGDFMRTTGMILLPGDTLYTLDEANRRANWISVPKGVVRSAPMPTPTKQEVSLSAIGRLPSGRIVWWSPAMQGRSGTVGERGRPKLPVMSSGLVREDLRLVDSIPGFETVIVRTAYRGREQSMEVPLRLWTGPSFALWDGAIAIANIGSIYAIERRAESGKVLSKVIVPVPRTPVTKAMREAVIERELARFEGPQSERMVDAAESRRQARENPFADSLPPIAQIYDGGDGTLWAVDGLVRGSPSRWAATQYRADGTILSRLNVTTPSVPMHFLKGYVVLRRMDDDDVVSLSMHRIVPAPRK